MPMPGVHSALGVFHLRTKGALLELLDIQNPNRELKSMAGLEKLSVFSGFQQTTNFKVTDEEGKILLELAEVRR